MSTDIIAKIDSFFALRKQIFAHVGYVEDWCVFPLDDCRGQFWRVDAAEREHCYYAATEAALNNEKDGNYYGGPIYTQRFLKKWVYRGARVTMVLVDTQTDGNKLLMLFDNDKERPKAAGG